MSYGPYIFFQLTNTFQGALVSDGVSSFTIYNFDEIQWVQGNASNVAAQVVKLFKN